MKLVAYKHTEWSPRADGSIWRIITIARRSTKLGFAIRINLDEPSCIISTGANKKPGHPLRRLAIIP